MLRLTLFVFALTHGMCASAAPDQVIVVRHAERATEPRADPSITREGDERAELLARMLAAANVQTIVTTNFRRTQETAAPLARRMGVTPVSVAMQRGELQAHVDEVVDRARRATGVVLVVGHSNTVASIVQALSSSSPTRLCARHRSRTSSSSRLQRRSFRRSS